MRVAILGCGYVGTGIGAALTAAGHDVLGTTTTRDRFGELEAAGIAPRLLDVADLETLRRLLVDRDAVYLTVAAGRQHADYERIYRRAVDHLLSASRGSAVRRVIYTSSTSVYGQTDGSEVDETSPTEPDSVNGRILVETERALLAGGAGIGLPATVLRLAGIYGPGRGPQNRVAALAGSTRDDGDAWVNLIHRDDIVAAAVRLLDVPHHGVLNLSDDCPLRRRELYDLIAAGAGLVPIRWRTPSGVPDLGKRVRSERIRELLGLRLAHPSAPAFYRGGPGSPPVRAGD